MDNIVSIYCDNVNVVERLSCIGRAQLAGAVVSAIDSFLDDSAHIRAECSAQLKLKHKVFIASIILTAVIGLSVMILVRRCKVVPVEKPEEIVEEGREVEQAVMLEDKIEEISQEPVENEEELLESQCEEICDNEEIVNDDTLDSLVLEEQDKGTEENYEENSSCCSEQESEVEL